MTPRHALTKVLIRRPACALETGGRTIPKSCLLSVAPLQRATACFLVSMLTWGPAHAQPAGSPTDRQLQAAYCLGVTQEQLADVKELKLTVPDPPRTLEAIFAEIKASDEAAHNGRSPEQLAEPTKNYKTHVDDLLAMAKSVYDGEIKIYVGQLKHLSYRQDMEKSRQRLYSYLVASGAFDYLTLAPAGPSGVTVARDNGVADQQQCFSATSICPGLPPCVSEVAAYIGSGPWGRWTEVDGSIQSKV